MNAPAALDRTADTVQHALAGVEALIGTDWSDVDAGEAPTVAAQIAQARSVLDGAMLAITARLEDTSAATALGWASTGDFLTHLLGGHKGTGGGIVRAVDQLAPLPAVREALEAGQISLPQARTIASKVTTLPRDPNLRTDVAGRMLKLIEAHGHDATDLQNAFGDVVREIDPDGTLLKDDRSKDKQERGAHHARSLSFAPDGLGGVRVRGYGTIEEAERIKSVLMPLAAPVKTEPGACGGNDVPDGTPLLDDNGHPTRTPCVDQTCAHDGRDPRDHGKRMWDALVNACEQLRAADTLPRDHGSVPRVVVLIDQESLRQKVIDAGLARDGELPSNERLSAQAVRRLACDAEIIPAVLGADGQVLDLGRTRRLVTAALFVALVVRDRHCAFPGCTRLPIACDAHHIVHWADGGGTDLDNLVLLCRQHHVMTHQTPWTVHIDPTTRQPVWTPPPKVDFRDRITYAPAHQRPGRPPGRPPSQEPLVA